VHFSVLIPTYNRPADLLACIDSIAMQSALPAQCVIVDDGALSESELALLRDRIGSIRLTYYRKDHSKEQRGQSTSKNIGLTLAAEDIVFIFDDDIVLEQHFFSSIMEVWGALDDGRLMGVGGFIANARKRAGAEKLYNSIFLLTSANAWDVTPVGFQVWDEGMKERQKGYYFNGGLCSVRRSKALSFPFSIFEAGRSALEEVDFCLRAKNSGYYVYMEPRARAIHNTSPMSREGVFQFGIKESANRREIFRTNAPRTIGHLLWFCWSSIGWVLRQFLAGNFRKGAGMLVGLFKT